MCPMIWLPCTASVFFYRGGILNGRGPSRYQKESDKSVVGESDCFFYGPYNYAVGPTCHVILLERIQNPNLKRLNLLDTIFLLFPSPSPSSCTMAEDLMQYFKPTSNFHQAGFTYAMAMWACFLVYCIIYQWQKSRTYLARRKALKTGLPQPYRPGAIAKMIHKLEYTVRLPLVGDYMAVKHLSILGVILVLNTIFILFAPFTISSDGFMLPAVSQMDRRAAYVAVVNFSFVILFGSRNTIVTKMSGLSFEQLIPYHRWLAKLGFAEMITHIVWRMQVPFIIFPFCCRRPFVHHVCSLR